MVSFVYVLKKSPGCRTLSLCIQLTNEFKFPIAAFHHASETYLVPELLKKAYGASTRVFMNRFDRFIDHTPASAIFATNARYKREAYRGSEFAARILSQNGLQVAMKASSKVHYFGFDSYMIITE